MCPPSCKQLESYLAAGCDLFVRQFASPFFKPNIFCSDSRSEDDTIKAPERSKEISPVSKLPFISRGASSLTPDVPSIPLSATGRETIYSWHFGAESQTIKGQVDEPARGRLSSKAPGAFLILPSREPAVSLRRDTGRRQAATWDQRGDFVVWARQSVGTPTTQLHHIHIGKRGTTRSHCFIACRFPSGKGRQLGSVLLLVVLLVVIGTDLTSTSVTTSIRFPFTIIDRYRDWFPAATAAGIRRGDVGSTGDRSC